MFRHSDASLLEVDCGVDLDTMSLLDELPLFFEGLGNQESLLELCLIVQGKISYSHLYIDCPSEPLRQLLLHYLSGASINLANFQRYFHHTLTFVPSPTDSLNPLAYQKVLEKCKK